MKDVEFEAGATVVVVEFGGNTLKRKVVSDVGRTVVVCTEDEFEAAISERRNPFGVGFPRSDVQLVEKNEGR